MAAIYTLRKSQPQLNRPYKVVGYPFVPAVFVAAAIYLVVNALMTRSEVDVDHFRRCLLAYRCTTSGLRSEPKTSVDLTPSTTTVVPLIQLAFGEARNAIAAPTSSGVPKRPNGSSCSTNSAMPFGSALLPLPPRPAFEQDRAWRDRDDANLILAPVAAPATWSG